jgi:hypothetical protein
MEIHGVCIHVAGSKVWAAPPGRAWIGDDGELVRDVAGKLRYAKVIGFVSHGVRSRWSNAIIRAVRAQYPALLAEVTDKDDDTQSLPLGENVA